MLKTITRTLLATLLVLVGAMHPATAAPDTLRIARAFYHVDQAARLILVNQQLTDLPVDEQRPATHLELDRVYTFAAPVARIQPTARYQVEAAGTQYTLFFTQIPVVSIATQDSIVDTPSVPAQFTLVQPNGSTVQSSMGIEIRGGFSQSYPKKSYELSFRADTVGDEARDLSLLGMRTDNKYNLQALYNEPLRMQSKVSNELWQEIHQIYYQAQEPEAKNGIAIEYVEVFVNGAYKGIYTLTERVDRKQLKLKKYSKGITGELYKGSSWDGASTFEALPPYSNASETWGGFEYKHPEELIDWSHLHEFVEYVMNSSDQQFYASYQQKFHLSNAVDYFIFLNLLRAGDNTGKNLYIAKYKQGEPYYYVPWDLDGVFGNDWGGNHIGYSGDILSNGFYNRLLLDYDPNGFRARVWARWAELRGSVITEAHILGKFQDNSALLLANNVYAREQLAWPGFTYNATELPYLTDWLRNRLRFLDDTFSQKYAPITATATPRLASLTLYPNPATDFLTVEASGSGQLLIHDLNGRTVLQAAFTPAQRRIDVRALRKGIYVATVKTGTLVATKKLLID